MGAGVNPPPEGSLPVPILTDDGAIDPLPDLGVPVLLGQGEAEVPCPVGIGGIVLPGSGGADHIKAGHLVSVRLVCLSLQGHRRPKRKPRASSGTGTGQLDIRTEPHSE